MDDMNSEEKRDKIKIDEDEYFLDMLPEEAKALITGLKAADLQTNMYQDTLKLIQISKSKMIEDLKKILENIEPIKS